MSYTGRGKNPNSIKNLKHEGRPMLVGEPKKVRSIAVSDTGWQMFKLVADEMGLSMSETIERLGRGDLKLVRVEKSHD